MSAAAAETIEETMLSAELWLSFGSVVRAYAAASSVDAALAPEVVMTAELITVTSGALRLDMRVDSQTGAGNWQLLRDETVKVRGQFALLPEGRIDIDGKTLDLDHAAIDLVAFVVSARDER
jgi:hypothetical protein